LPFVSDLVHASGQAQRALMASGSFEEAGKAGADPERTFITRNSPPGSSLQTSNLTEGIGMIVRNASLLLP
jgi:hypothetical protein